jgi:23S rRNA (cytidine1920-2'-O)/16S rRNA (cytidine1409-2'-O)-methyltransferase
MADGGQVIALVKPQFEAGKEEVPRGGVVIEPATWRRVLERVAEEARAAGLRPRAIIRSPITGGDGNVEFLMALGTDPATAAADLSAMIEGAL